MRPSRARGALRPRRWAIASLPASRPTSSSASKPRREAATSSRGSTPTLRSESLRGATGKQRCERGGDRQPRPLLDEEPLPCRVDLEKDLFAVRRASEVDSAVDELKTRHQLTELRFRFGK